MKCRACGAEDVPLTLIYRPDKHGNLVPHSGVCYSCSAPRPYARMPARVFTAYKPGRCAYCAEDIIPGEKLSRIRDGPVLHAECAEVAEPAR